MMLIQCLKFKVFLLLTLFIPTTFADEEDYFRQKFSEYFNVDETDISVERATQNLEWSNIFNADLIINTRIKCISGYGRCSLTIKQKVEFGYKTTVLWFKVKLKKKVPVLKEDVKLGAVLNLSLVNFDYQFIDFDQYLEINELEGKAFRINLGKGSVVTVKDLKNFFHVSEGDSIDVKFESSDISLSFEAVSLDKGNKGDKIRVIWKGSIEPIFVILTENNEAYVI